MSQLSKIKKMMDESEEAMSLTDRDWDGEGPYIVYVNQNWQNLTGYKLIEVIGKSPKILQGPKTIKAELDGFREKLDNSKIFNCTTWNHRKDGQPLRIEMVVFNLGDIKDYYLAIQRNVTNIKTEDIVSMKASELKTLMKIINL